MAQIDAFGDDADKITLTSQRARVVLSSFGAGMLELWVPDRAGTLQDVLLGLAHPSDYLDNPACHGMTIGPLANRTDKAEVPLLGKVYHLEKNDGPTLENNLHSSHTSGLQKRIFSYRADEQSARFSCTLKDGELGLPGNKQFGVTYTLTDVDYARASDGKASRLVIELSCKSDAPCPINMTNHSYFNLSGHASGSVEDTLLKIYAEKFLPLREDSVSLGVLEDVVGTPFDFREERTLHDALSQEHEQLLRAKGIDHCFVIDNFSQGATPRRALTAKDPTSKRALDIEITAPAAHLYTGNWLDDTSAKDGAHYLPRAGFAFEPEYYPDFVHHKDWPASIVTPEAPYLEKIVYYFYTY